jgi:acetolactate decarboxylase
MNKFFTSVGVVTLVACTTTAFPSIQDGLLIYAGSQKTIFSTGKAEAKVPVSAMSGAPDVFGVGAVAGLDGEITVLAGKPYVTKVRGNTYTIDNSQEHMATFAVWTHQAAWVDQSVPLEVKGYLDVQNFVKARAVAAGIDVSKPFPFQLVGTPIEVKWHINVDLTDGKHITNELFAKSKASYVIKNEPMDIIGFYSEKHPGVFISAYVPAISTDRGDKNAMHIHMVTRDGKSAGHIDNLALGAGMTLRLPKI